MASVISDKVGVLPHYYKDTLLANVVLSVDDNLINSSTGYSVSFDIKFNTANHTATGHWGNLFFSNANIRVLYNGEIRDMVGKTGNSFYTTDINQSLNCNNQYDADTSDYRIIDHDDQWQFLTFSFNPDGTIVIYKNGEWAFRYHADLTNASGKTIKEVCLQVIADVTDTGITIFGMGNSNMGIIDQDSDAYRMKNVYIDMAMDDVDAEVIYHSIHPKHSNIYYGIKSIIQEYKRRQIAYNRIKFAKRKHFDMLMGTKETPGSIKYVVNKEAEYGQYKDDITIKDALDKLHRQWGVTINNQLYNITYLNTQNGSGIGEWFANTSKTDLVKYLDTGKLGIVICTSNNNPNVIQNSAATVSRALPYEICNLTVQDGSSKEFILIGNPWLAGIPGYEDNGCNILWTGYLNNVSGVYKYTGHTYLSSGIDLKSAGRLRVGSDILFTTPEFNQISKYGVDGGEFWNNYVGMYSCWVFVENNDLSTE